MLPPGGGGDAGRVDRLTLWEALEWIEETLVFVLGALADPEGWAGYADGRDDPEADLDALDELEAVQLAGLRASFPDAADRDSIIVGRMGALRAEIARLGSLRSANLRQEYGTGHGAPAKAARALDCSHETARRALAAGGAYADRVREGAQRARERG